MRASRAKQFGAPSAGSGSKVRDQTSHNDTSRHQTRHHTRTPHVSGGGARSRCTPAGPELVGRVRRPEPETVQLPAPASPKTASKGEQVISRSVVIASTGCFGFGAHPPGQRHARGPESKRSARRPAIQPGRHHLPGRKPEKKRVVQVRTHGAGGSHTAMLKKPVSTAAIHTHRLATPRRCQAGRHCKGPTTGDLPRGSAAQRRRSAPCLWQL